LAWAFGYLDLGKGFDFRRRLEKIDVCGKIEMRVDNESANMYCITSKSVSYKSE
jgi:hypothetical protein